MLIFFLFVKISLISDDMGHNVRKCTFGQFLVLEKQSYFDCMMFLESVSLYLTRLFQLLHELWPIYFMNPTDGIVLKNDVKVAKCISACK